MIYVATNAVRASALAMLAQTGLLEYIDAVVTNEDVEVAKPHAEVYLTCMLRAGVNPDECLIVEDSYVGQIAAHRTGAQVLGVDGPHKVTLGAVEAAIREMPRMLSKPLWTSNNLVVLVPMAGAGRRFREAGHTMPKPLIDVHGRPMIQWVLENLRIRAPHVFVVQREHAEQFNITQVLRALVPEAVVVVADGLLEGAVCSTLLAREHIDTDKRLLIVNADQYLEWKSGEFMYEMAAADVDGGIVTFEATESKWSFVRTEDGRHVSEVAEKRPISTRATAGVYYWKKGCDYVHYA
jgi:CTP:phosphocholine cytidylyltransferase-like protein